MGKDDNSKKDCPGEPCPCDKPKVTCEETKKPDICEKSPKPDGEKSKKTDIREEKSKKPDVYVKSKKSDIDEKPIATKTKVSIASKTSAASEKLKESIKLPSFKLKTDKLNIADKFKRPAVDTSQISNQIKSKLKQCHSKLPEKATVVKFLKSLTDVNNWKAIAASINQPTGDGRPRPMKFAYTYSAKIAQFPLGFYVKNQWIWKHYAASFVLCLPIFAYISSLANSPSNKAKWAEIRRKEAMEREQHHH